MDTEIIIIIAVAAVIIVAGSIFFLTRKKTEKPVVVNESIFGLFDPKNIEKVDFVRNKLVVSFKDVTQFDVNKLKEFGGKGISVIGDKVKFFISDQLQDNETLYTDLVKHIER